MVGLQHLIIHPRLVVKSVHKALGHDLHQIVIALVVLRQQYKMVIPVLPADRLPVEPGARSHIHLTADDRLYSHLSGRPVEVDDPVHDSMVCDSHTVHTKLLCPGHQLPDLAGTVQKTVFRMDMQMCKCHDCLLLFPDLSAKALSSITKISTKSTSQEVLLKSLYDTRAKSSKNPMQACLQEGF